MTSTINKSHLILKKLIDKPKHLKSLEDFLVRLTVTRHDIDAVLRRSQNKEFFSRLLYDNQKPVGIFLINFLRIFSKYPKALYIYNFIITQNETEEVKHSYREVMLNCIFEKAKEMSLKLIVLDLKESFNEKNDTIIKNVASSNDFDFKLMSDIKLKYQTQNNSNVNKRKLADDSPMTSKKAKREDKTIEVTLKKIYVNYIQSGAKTIEGRINSGMFKSLKIGQTIRFFYFQNQSDDAVCKVIDIKNFESFKEMLEKEDYKKCIPSAYDKHDAIRAYDNIPGYRERANKFGVIAIYLELIKK